MMLSSLCQNTYFQSKKMKDLEAVAAPLAIANVEISLFISYVDIVTNCDLSWLPVVQRRTINEVPPTYIP
jgi:hypothetical protein